MKKILFPFILAMSLAACSHDDRPPAPVYQSVAPVASPAAAPAAAPVIVNAAPASSGAGDMIAGAAMGYMLGASTAHHAAPAPAVASTSNTTINKTVINKTVVVKQAPPPRPAPAAPAPVSLTKAPSPAAPSYRPSTASYAPTRSTPSYAPTRSYTPSVSYSGMRK